MLRRSHIVNKKNFPAQFGDSIRSYGISTIRPPLQCVEDKSAPFIFVEYLTQF